jgi:hypothetical protein
VIRGKRVESEGWAALFGALGLAMAALAIALWADRPRLLAWAVRVWVVGGLVLLLFGAMSFYTHIGMDDNIAYGNDAKW